jgi:hypothetical protein
MYVVGRSPKALTTVANSNSQPHRWQGGTFGMSALSIIFLLTCHLQPMSRDPSSSPQRPVSN